MKTLLFPAVALGLALSFTINNAGVAGGTYIDADGNFQAFLAFPAVPEPSTWALLVLGFAGLSVTGWRRRLATKDRAPHG
jgi:hypothetical protein